MPLANTYQDKNCSLARTLELVGERWTLLVIRDAFYGVRRFGDFATQLGVPRAVLINRLKLLVREGILTREVDGNVVEYLMTTKGVALWPVLRAIMAWGDVHESADGPKRVFRHVLDDGTIDALGRCDVCQGLVEVPEIRVERGPGFDRSAQLDDPVSDQLDAPRLLLEPMVLAAANAS